MKKQNIKLERSPFNKQRNMKAPRGSVNLQTQVSQDMFEDFMLYARHYNAEHHVPKTKRGETNKSTPLKHIINEFLNSHALERKCFTDLYVIMAFNKIDFQTPFNTDVQGAIIGFVDHPQKFTNFHPFRLSHKYKQNIIYALEDFNKDTFDLLNLKQFDREVLFNIHPSIYEDFDATREHLQREHDHLDFDNAQICMFNVNNYLDILKDGVYMSEHSTYSHEGFVVLFDPDDVFVQDRIIARFNWSYIAGGFNFEFNVESEGLFNTQTCYHAPVEVFNEYWSTSSGFLSQRAKLEMNLKHAQQSRDDHKKAFEMRERQISKIKQSLDEIKNKQ